jgi:hypothetical protein
MYFAIICIAYLASLSTATYASDDDRSVSGSDRYIESDDDSYSEHQNEKKKEAIKKNKEKLREKLEKLRQKRKSNHHQTQTGSTLSGTLTQTGTTKSPVATPVKPATPVTPTKPATPVTPTPAPVVAAVTKTATITYRTPDGSDPVTFTATVKGGVITAASSVTKARNGTSIWYQDTFATKLSQSVVGKKVAGLNLSAIGGASLTTTAFEQFISTSF